MPNKQQSTGMTGLYLVAAELSTRGFIVSPTSRSAQAADLLVTDGACRHTYAVQVKTNARSFRAWLVNANTATLLSDNFIYALVNLTKKGPIFYLAPSRFIARHVKFSPKTSTNKFPRYSVSEEAVRPYREKWDVFKGNGVHKPAHVLYRSAPLRTEGVDLLAEVQSVGRTRDKQIRIG